MKSQKNKWANQALDTFMGYAVVVLALICFMLFLAFVAFVIRFFAGGASW